jgi:DNA segregation ATPase FtsK/SpoIIIE-like protein
MSNIETLSQTLLETLQEKPTTAEEKNALKEKVQMQLLTLRDDAETKALQQKFQLDWQKLDESVREQVKENLSGIQLLSLMLEKEELKGEVEEEKSFAERAQETVQTVGDTAENAFDAVVPEKYSKNLSRGQKIALFAAGTAGVGIVGVYAFKALNWIGNKMKSTFERTVESAKKVGGFLLKAGLMIGIPLLIFSPKIRVYSTKKRSGSGGFCEK